MLACGSARTPAIRLLGAVADDPDDLRVELHEDGRP